MRICKRDVNEDEPENQNINCYLDSAKNLEFLRVLNMAVVVCATDLQIHKFGLIDMYLKTGFRLFENDYKIPEYF